MKINIFEKFKHHRNRTQRAVPMVFEFFKNIDFQSVKKFQISDFLCISIGHEGHPLRAAAYQGHAESCGCGDDEAGMAAAVAQLTTGTRYPV